MVSSVFSQIYAPYFPVDRLGEELSAQAVQEVGERAGQKWVAFEEEWNTFLQESHPPYLGGVAQWDEATLRSKAEELVRGGVHDAKSPLRVMVTALAICTFALLLLALIAFPYLAIPGFIAAVATAGSQALLSVRTCDRERLINAIALQGFFFARSFFQEGPRPFYEERLEREVLFTVAHPLSYLDEKERQSVEAKTKILVEQKLKEIGDAFADHKMRDEGELAQKVASSFAKGEMPDCSYETSKKEILRQIQPQLAQVLSLHDAVEKNSLEKSLHQTPREVLLALTRKMRSVAELSPASIRSFSALKGALLAEGWTEIGATGLKSNTVSFAHKRLSKLELQLFVQPSASGNPAAFLLKAAMAEKLAHAIRDLRLETIGVVKSSLLPLLPKERLCEIDEHNLSRAFAFVRKRDDWEKPLSQAGQDRGFWVQFGKEMKRLIEATGFSCSPEALVYDEKAGKVLIVDPSPARRRTSPFESRSGLCDERLPQKAKRRFFAIPGGRRGRLFAQSAARSSPLVVYCTGATFPVGPCTLRWVILLQTLLVVELPVGVIAC